MHHIIRFVVPAETEEEALEQAKEWLDNISGEDSKYSIDYGTFFDEDGSAVSGKGRWGDRPPAPKMDTKEGMSLFLNGCLADYTSFVSSCKDAREILNNKTDHEIYDASMDKYRIKRIDDLEFVFHEYHFSTMMDLARFLFDKNKISEIHIIPCDVHT